MKPTWFCNFKQFFSPWISSVHLFWKVMIGSQAQLTWADMFASFCTAGRTVHLSYTVCGKTPLRNKPPKANPHHTWAIPAPKHETREQKKTKKFPSVSPLYQCLFVFFLVPSPESGIITEHTSWRHMCGFWYRIFDLYCNLYRNSATRPLPLRKCGPAADPLTAPNSGPFTDHTYNTVPQTPTLKSVPRESH